MRQRCRRPDSDHTVIAGRRNIAAIGAEAAACDLGIVALGGRHQAVGPLCQRQLDAAFDGRISVYDAGRHIEDPSQTRIVHTCSTSLATAAGVLPLSLPAPPSERELSAEPRASPAAGAANVAGSELLLLLLLLLLLPFVFALSRLSGCSAAPEVVTAVNGTHAGACAESA
jgi:hypothetical protein